MSEQSIPALAAPARAKDNPLTRSAAGMIGIVFLTVMIVACLGSLPWTLARVTDDDGVRTAVRQYDHGSPAAGRIAPVWWPADEREIERRMDAVPIETASRIADEAGVTLEQARAAREGEVYERMREYWPRFTLGSDPLGRSLLVRVLTGGGISLGIGIAAAMLSVIIGTLYGAISGYVGGKTDALLMRIVDILYGLPYILLVVLLAVAVEAVVENRVAHRVAAASERRDAFVEGLVAELPGEVTEAELAQFEAEALARFGTGEISGWRRDLIGVGTLLVAIGGVSWLTMARVVRGQVLSLKAQPFVEAARSIGVGPAGVFSRHLLPNLIGPIVVYATLAVPQAILQESFLSFLGIGVRPPLPSWGNLAADGLVELNRHRSHWWLLLFPCLLLGLTLLALNFVGEGLREAFDPKRARR